MSEPSYSLWCDHCGCEAITRAVNEFSDGEGDRCESCGLSGGVSCDSETPADWVTSEEPEDLCLLEDCGECNERRALSACGLAFDAGMREAERDRLDERLRDLKQRVWHSGHEACVKGHPEWCKSCGTQAMLEAEKQDAAVAAERERCATLARRAERLIYSSALDTESLRVLVRMRLDIESGAPAPREG